jgi:hypothetical protein
VFQWRATALCDASAGDVEAGDAKVVGGPNATEAAAADVVETADTHLAKTVGF